MYTCFKPALLTACLEMNAELRASALLATALTSTMLTHGSAPAFETSALELVVLADVFPLAVDAGAENAVVGTDIFPSALPTEVLPLAVTADL